MDLVDFTNCKSDNEYFDGDDGAKKGIIYNNEKWILKFGKSTSSMENVNISYTNSPICEYIGSKIYESIGLPVHTTLLGSYSGTNRLGETKKYLVVACKNFKTDIDDRFYSFLEISNNFNPDYEENQNLDLDYTIDRIKNNGLVSSEEFIERFWSMFIIDALINNNDRHYGNFGLLENKGRYSIAPVYDNGSSFYNKIDKEKSKDILINKEKFISSAYESRISMFEKDGKKLNPYKVIESMKYDECNKMLLRIIPLIDLEKIYNIIDLVPTYFNDNEVFPNEVKLFYKDTIKYGYEVLLKVYKNLQ